MQLTKNFSLEELVFSQTAARLGIDNMPDADIQQNLVHMAWFLQSLRELVNKNVPSDKPDIPIIVTSGYRCERLNKAIGGSSTSEHRFGRAADIICPVMTPKELAEFIRDYMMDEPGFNQLIHEFGEWVHVSIPEIGVAPKRQVLTAANDAHGVQYMLGIVEAA